MKPLWITYTWADNQVGDFDFLVGELEKFGISGTYDRVTLVPGKRLWDQIDQRIRSDELAGLTILREPANTIARLGANSR